MKFYIVPHPDTTNLNYGYTCPRGDEIVREGLLDLKQELVDNPQSADFIIQNYLPHINKELDINLLDKYPKNKLICIDWRDNPNENFDYNCSYYFKRSWTHPLKTSGICEAKVRKDKPLHWFPINYGILKAQYTSLDTKFKNLDVGCILRATCANRIRAISLLKESIEFLYNKKGYIFTSHLGEISKYNYVKNQQPFTDPEYIRILRDTKILLTCQPSYWEGDSRLFEGLANRCLIFSDRITHPLCDFIHNEHLIYYDISSNIDIYANLIDIINDNEKINKIAEAGQKLAMAKHTAKNRMQLVLDVIK